LSKRIKLVTRTGLISCQNLGLGAACCSNNPRQRLTAQLLAVQQTSSTATTMACGSCSQHACINGSLHSSLLLFVPGLPAAAACMAARAAAATRA